MCMVFDDLLAIEVFNIIIPVFHSFSPVFWA